MYLIGECHLEEGAGPAFELHDVTKMWYINGERHRVKGAAIEWSYGTKEWYINGKRHRENGSAIEYADGTKTWFLNGTQYSEKEFNKKFGELTKLSQESPKDSSQVPSQVSFSIHTAQIGEIKFNEKEVAKIILNPNFVSSTFNQSDLSFDVKEENGKMELITISFK